MTTIWKTLEKFKYRFQVEVTTSITVQEAKRNERKSQERKLKREKRKEKRAEDEVRKLHVRKESEEEFRLARITSDARAAKVEPMEMRERYGMINVDYEESRDRLDITLLSVKSVGEEVYFQARIHTIRKMSSNLAFLILRQQTTTIQGVLKAEDDIISTHMVRWAEKLSPESVVLITGTVQKPSTAISSPSIHDIEILITKIHVIAEPVKPLPFIVYEAEEVEVKRKKEDSNETLLVNDRMRLSNRIIDLRTPTSQSIFRINAAIGNIFRTTLTDQNFLEIHTPKLQAGATESGASVFEVSYFNRSAFLAQSPQLSKQMALGADFDRVFEIGPVFRAENSNTHRHLTEFVGLDLEMTIQKDYHEAVNLIDEMLKRMFKEIYERYRTELEIIKRRFPHEDLVWLDKTPVIPFAEGIQLLLDSGWTDEGKAPSRYKDLSTRAEIQLGKLVKEKYHTDYYILDKFPTSARPFYTKLDPDDSQITNSFDIFLRGQEIVSGSQRIHEPHVLKKRMRDLGISTNGMEDYLETFEYGVPPHAGCGIGLERLVMLLLNLGNIRFSSLFPRDPKSLPARTLPLELRHPEASTSPPPWKHPVPYATRRPSIPGKDHEYELQSIEKLIANYGDASNTSWLDDRYQVWRHRQTGAAIGYVPSADSKFAIIVGNPLCASHQYSRVVNDFLQWLKTDAQLRPIWILVGKQVEEILSEKLGWSTLTCAAEKRVNKSLPEYDEDVKRKIRRAKSQGVIITEFPFGKPVPEDLKRRCDERIKEWLQNRQGTQVHLTNINPWRDLSHRRVFIAEGSDDQKSVHALVVLAQLSSEHGYQVKYSLDFPGAPNGTIEAIITHAVQSAYDSGARSVTFGAAATADFVPVHGLGGLQVTLLRYCYKAIVNKMHLANKGKFREKLGAEEDPLYIGYPEYGLGPGGIRAMLDFFTAEV